MISGTRRSTASVKAFVSRPHLTNQSRRSLGIPRANLQRKTVPGRQALRFVDLLLSGLSRFFMITSSLNSAKCLSFHVAGLCVHAVKPDQHPDESSENQFARVCVWDREHYGHVPRLLVPLLLQYNRRVRSQRGGYLPRLPKGEDASVSKELNQGVTESRRRWRPSHSVVRSMGDAVEVCCNRSPWEDQLSQLLRSKRFVPAGRDRRDCLQEEREEFDIANRLSILSITP